MGATIPAGIADTPLSRRLEQFLPLVHRGKVRDTYALPRYPDLLLVVATDRLSIFDFVLNVLIPQKGEVLTAFVVFWLTQVFYGYPNHLVAHGADIYRYLSGSRIWPVIRGLHNRALIVKKVEILPRECIARGYLTGSGWGAYQKNGMVCGIELPEGLSDGSELPMPIFTPSTKADQGHDEHVSAQSVHKEYGLWVGRETLSLYEYARTYAFSRGIIIADTKFEFGVDGILADEILTPDSSRFWDIDEYNHARSMGKSPSGYDKEPLRQAGKKAIIDGEVCDISKLDPQNPEDVARVARWVVPEREIEQMTYRYLEVSKRLTGVDRR